VVFSDVPRSLPPTTAGSIDGYLGWSACAGPAPGGLLPSEV
jgi:hypothetical protein